MSKQATEGDCLPTEGAGLLHDNLGSTPPKIMVVEDEFLVALNIKEDLMLSGYEVPAIARSGEEAICKAVEVLPDLILMDITLDGLLDGITAAAEIRKAHAIPIIYLTAHAGANTIEKAKATMPFGFLPKPCNRETMISMIEIALYKNKVDTERQRLERRSFEDELSAKAAKLQDASTALRVLLEQRSQDENELKQNIQTNLDKLIIPSLRALENSTLTESQKILIESIKIQLQLICDMHLSKFFGNIANLSCTEMQVANFVKAGKSTKEIAQFLSIASSTVNSHRDSIRKKLRIKNTKTNLKKELRKIL